MKHRKISKFINTNVNQFAFDLEPPIGFNILMQTTLLIAVLGLLGVLCRYGIDRLLTDWNLNFPVSTLAINIIGCAVAGSIAALDRSLTSPWSQALMVGFCGGFTTFSAYALQAVTLIERGRLAASMIYLFLSPALGLTAAGAALYLTRVWFPR